MRNIILTVFLSLLLILILLFLCNMSVYMVELKEKADIGDKCLREHKEKEKIMMRNGGVWKEWEVTKRYE